MKPEILKNFYVLEGLDGAGTTTQLDKLTERAQAENLPLDRDFEPTRGVIGSFLRQILVGELTVARSALPFLFAADRAEHLDGGAGIRSRLAAGRKVLSDRYLFSSLAYQGTEGAADWIKTLNRQFPLPEAVFFLDIDVPTAQKRIAARGGKPELFDAAELQEKIRLGYEQSWEQLTDTGCRLVRIDATLSIPEITAKLWAEIYR